MAIHPHYHASQFFLLLERKRKFNERLKYLYLGSSLSRYFISYLLGRRKAAFCVTISAAAAVADIKQSSSFSINLRQRGHASIRQNQLAQLSTTYLLLLPYLLPANVVIQMLSNHD